MTETKPDATETKILSVYPVFESGSLDVAHFMTVSGTLRTGGETKPSCSLDVAKEVDKSGLAELIQGSKDTKIVGVAPAARTVIKVISLPPVDDSEINRAVKYEAQQYIPFPLEEIAWNYEKVGTSEGMMNICLCAVKTDWIRLDLLNLNLDMLVAPHLALRWLYQERTAQALLSSNGVVLLHADDMVTTFLESGTSTFFTRSINSPLINDGRMTLAERRENAARLCTQVNQSIGYVRGRMGINPSSIWVTNQDLSDRIFNPDPAGPYFQPADAVRHYADAGVQIMNPFGEFANADRLSAISPEFAYAAGGLMSFHSGMNLLANQLSEPAPGMPVGPVYLYRSSEKGAKNFAFMYFDGKGQATLHVRLSEDEMHKELADFVRPGTIIRNEHAPHPADKGNKPLTTEQMFRVYAVLYAAEELKTFPK